jgi:hypothetical protein
MRDCLAGRAVPQMFFLSVWNGYNAAVVLPVTCNDLILAVAKKYILELAAFLCCPLFYAQF